VIRPILLLISSTLACHLLAEDLQQELQRRASSEGLGLIRATGSPIFLYSFGGEHPTEKNPRDISTGSIAQGGAAVVWSLHYIGRRCGSPMLIEVPAGIEKWRVPGDVINAVAGVSPNGESVAFWGTYKPPGSGELNTAQNRSSIRGLHYASKSGGVTTIIQRPLPASRQLEDYPVSSISWSPNGRAFVYDDRGEVFIYEVAAKRSRQVASGSAPEWSADGKWISFRSSNGYASAIDSVSLAPRDLFGPRKIRYGVHWSPDSRYVMLSEPVGFLSNLLHWRDILIDGEMIVLRIDDGAAAHVEWEYDLGIDDHGFYWVSNYRVFLKAASIRPSISNCQ
jgi:hypothetical protein